MKHSAALKIASPSSSPRAPLSEPPNTQGVDEAWFGEQAPVTHRSYVERRSGPFPKVSLSPRPGGFHLRPSSVPPEAPVRRATPKADVFVSPAATLILIDAPGVSASNITLTISEGSLHYRSTRTAAESGSSYATCFERSFVLEHRIDAAEVDATLRHGVLRVRLPAGSKAPCRVTVRSSDVEEGIVELEPADMVEL